MEELKNSSNTSEYIQEIRNCIIWSLNILNELIASSPDVVGKVSKNEASEQKKKESTVNYLFIFS
jgi:hypothetical protein